MIAAATPQHLPGVLHDLEPTLDRFGYLAVVGLVLLEDFGIPVPGETVLILAAVYAGTGRLTSCSSACSASAAPSSATTSASRSATSAAGRSIKRYGRYIFLTT